MLCIHFLVLRAPVVLRQCISNNKSNTNGPLIIFNSGNYLKEQLETAKTEVSFHHSNETKEACHCMFKTTAKMC